MFKLHFVPNPTAKVFATVGENPPKPADFYRFTPTAEMTDQEIQGIKGYLLSTGAAVKVLPKERKRKTVSKTKAVKAKAKSPRETVTALVDASSSKDKDALKDECRAKMDEYNV